MIPPSLAAAVVFFCLILASGPSFGQTTCAPGSNYATSTVAGSVFAGNTDIGNHCDDCMTDVLLPFPVAVYDTTFGLAHISSNGNVQFNSSNAGAGGCLPVPFLNWAILPHMDDLRTDANPGCAAFPGGNCGVFAATTGVAPNRVFHIEWRAVLFNLPATSVNFELRLHESNAHFEVVYGVLGGGGTGATAGVQRDTGSLFTQFACGTGLPNNTQVSYTCALVPVELMGFGIE